MAHQFPGKLESVVCAQGLRAPHAVYQCSAQQHRMQPRERIKWVRLKRVRCRRQIRLIEMTKDHTWVIITILIIISIINDIIIIIKVFIIITIYYYNYYN